MVATLLLLAQILFYSVVPSITYQPEKEYAFRVTHETHAAGFCTFFESQTETLEMDGHKVPWTPTHCGVLQANQTAYYDNWDEIQPVKGGWRVWSEVYYDLADGKMATSKSNVLSIVY